MILRCQVTPDEFTNKVSEAFDYNYTGVTEFELPNFDKPTKPFQLGLIVGSSGSGKTQIARHHFGYKEAEVKWDGSKSILSHFENPDVAVEKLFAVGIASVPTLCKPFHVLSNGEQHRSLIARQLQDGAIIDEFTSVVNRETAFSLSVSLSKYIRNKHLQNIVLVSCHRDIINWLEPDWVFDTDAKQFSKNELDCKTAQKVARIEIYTIHSEGGNEVRTP